MVLAVAHPRASTTSYLSPQFLTNSRSETEGGVGRRLDFFRLHVIPTLPKAKSLTGGTTMAPQPVLRREERLPPRSYLAGLSLILPILHSCIPVMLG